MDFIKNFSVLLLLISIKLHGQANLIINPSLEQWKDGMPTNWEIITKSVDIFKSDMRIVPLGMSSEHYEFRNKFPDCGHDGLTYFGIAWDEIIQCSLYQPLETGKLYELSFWVNKPPLYSAVVSNKLSVKFTANPANKNINHNTVTGYETVFKKDSTSFIADEWENVKYNYIAKGGERFLTFGFMKDLHANLGLEATLIYYLYDDFQLREKTVSTTSFSIYFENDLHQLTRDHIRLINSQSKLAFSIDSILVEGFASDVGDSLYNIKISQARSESTREWLNNNLNVTLLKSLYYGESYSESTSPEEFRKVNITCFNSASHLLNNITNNCAFDTSLMKVIAQVEYSDQQIRLSYDSALRASPNNRILLKQIEGRMVVSDSINLSTIENLIQQYGYPGISLVSPNYMNTAFFVIQHAPLEVREKHLDLLYEACQKGEMNKQLLPYLIDRNKLDNGLNQIYGTQLKWNEKLLKFELFPVENIDNIDLLRAEYHLGSIKKYLASFNE